MIALQLEFATSQHVNNGETPKFAIGMVDKDEGIDGVDIMPTAHPNAREIDGKAELPFLVSRSKREAEGNKGNEDSDGPNGYSNIDELANISPVENTHERRLYHHESLEHDRREQGLERQDDAQQEGARETDRKQQPKISSLATQLYTISYLVFFSFLGTLARLGLQALTFYPGAPVAFSELWANFGGCVLMGFLAEDRKLFREEWGNATYYQTLEQSKGKGDDVKAAEIQAAKRAHTATKKTIPLFIGLSTGFCGCFTSFSSFIRDAFLALSNTMPDPDHLDYHTLPPRNGGHSFMALLAVIIATITICLSGLFLGVHIAKATEPVIFSIPFKISRKWIDPAIVFVAFGCWLGAILLAVFPPHEVWRGRAVFSLAFAPLGCLARFYLSILLNGKVTSFPLGTFVANISGTAVLGMCWDLQHVPLGGVIGCQVLQGVQDGFCGCLTTVSTWVVELSSLKGQHAYRYGSASVVAGLALLVVIMGSMKWTIGFDSILCTH